VTLGVFNLVYHLFNCFGNFETTSPNATAKITLVYRSDYGRLPVLSYYCRSERKGEPHVLRRQATITSNVFLLFFSLLQPLLDYSQHGEAASITFFKTLYYKSAKV
jgi:hypothetical protein